ncbi:hypothetical protein H480_03513 [Amycolatopsis vancoresmycina DSM 44592]|uniref:Uncharacterized protein n=1 Tax=Amycolatopsis vancoresmycina DSM 44592 TaxID=1292037 RepID=R1GFG9_9PSEU|nr:hypothetical protein H480_03513 [Amycolatopsis vancoresmycina DSM 44592]
MLRRTIRSIASSQLASASSPFLRTRGVVSRSGDELACQAKRSFGSRRPWLTRSSARPRTPAIRPSLTAMSSPSPLECSTAALRTHRSTSAGRRPPARWLSTRTGHGSPGP